MRIFSAHCDSEARLDGKTVIVTGCNTGIGKETAKDFYKRGARVIMACRNLEKAEDAKTDITKCTLTQTNLGELLIKKLDLTSLRSVRAFADDILGNEAQINILVNNAGVMMCPQGKTEDGFEVQFGTNHLAHFLLTLLLLPLIIKSAPARIVTVSSVASLYGKMDFDDLNSERKTYSPWKSYCQSKLANVLFSKGLSDKLKRNGIQNVTCYSLHPGAIMSDLPRHLDSAVFRGSYFLLKRLFSWFMKTTEQGAQTTIYCAVDEKCANESGLYYKECEVTQDNTDANNEDIVEKLWKISLDLVGLDDKEICFKQ